MRCILFVNGDEFEVHFVSRGEHVGGTLDDGLPRFRHRDGRAPGQENGLVPGAEGQGAGVTPLHEDHLKYSRTSYPGPILGENLQNIEKVPFRNCISPQKSYQAGKRHDSTIFLHFRY